MPRSLRSRERALYALAGLTAAVVFLLPSAAKADTTERERVLAAIHYASGESGISEAKTTRVADCESSLRENPPGRAYGGTMQQSRRHWPSRVAEFNRWANSTGHPTMSGTIGAAIDNVRLSLWMVSSKGNWGDWPSCGRR